MAKQTVDGILDKINGDDALASDCFMPTGLKGLTKKQLKILQTCLLPVSDKMTVVQKAAHAGVSERYWYLTVDKPEIQDIIKSFAVTLLERRALPFWRAYMKLAIEGDRQALERLLFKAKLFTSEDAEAMRGKETLDVNVRKLTNEEIDAELAAAHAAHQAAKSNTDD